MSKGNYRSILISSIWIGLIALLFISMGFVNVSQSKVKCNDLNIAINADEGMYFVDKDQVREFIYGSIGDPIGMEMKKIDMSALELSLTQLDAVKNAEVYSSLNGGLKIEIEQRKPIARIFMPDGNSFYMDEDGEKMSLSVRYTARVIAINGSLMMSENEAENMEQWMDLYKLVKLIEQDELFAAQFEQIYVKRNGEMELSPRVGRHSILLGKADGMEDKLKKLKLFYSDGIAKVDWNKYKQIDLRFKDQVVCAKR